MRIRVLQPIAVAFLLALVAAPSAAQPLPPDEEAAGFWRLPYPQLPEPRRDVSPFEWFDVAPLPPAPPRGIAAGPLTLFPAVTAGGYFDDNVFASHSGRQSDWAYFLRPELGWRHRGPQHLIEGSAHLEMKRYARFESENQLTGGVAVGGTVQPDRDTQLQGRVRYLHGQESRGSGESLLNQSAKPLAYDQVEGAAAFNRRNGRHWISLGTGASWIQYGTPTIGGVPVDQSYRDGIVTLVSARGGYVVAPLTSLFVEWAGNRRDFGVAAFDSKGFRVVAGALFEPGGNAPMRGEIYLGIMHQDYVGETFASVSTWTYGASLAVRTLPQLTTTLLGRREAKESALGGGASVIETAAGIRMDYQVNPRFSVGAGLSYLTQEFLSMQRTDRTWNPLLAANYLLTPNLTLAFDYRHLDFDSNGFGTLGYGRNVYLLALNGRF
jgi:hypothetical protein